MKKQKILLVTILTCTFALALGISKNAYCEQKNSKNLSWDEVCFQDENCSMSRKNDKLIAQALNMYDEEFKKPDEYIYNGKVTYVTPDKNKEKNSEKIEPSKNIDIVNNIETANVELRKKNADLTSKDIKSKKTDIKIVSNSDESKTKGKNPFGFIKGKLGATYGYRMDELQFNIAGNRGGGSPNILSELTWDDIKSRETRIKGELAFFDMIILDGSIAYSDIYSGKVQDSDYALDDRDGEFSRSLSRTNEGELSDWSSGLGLRWFLGAENEYLYVDKAWVTGLAGYSHHEQNFTITDGEQIIPAYGSFAGLHSNYWTEWKGPWLGLELSAEKGKFDGFFRVEYHQVDYHADANWNLRSDLDHPISFEHSTDGMGFVFDIGTAYHITPNWSVDFNTVLQDWRAWEGVDIVHLDNGTYPQTQLNEVKWKSWAIMAGTTYHF